MRFRDGLAWAAFAVAALAAAEFTGRWFGLGAPLLVDKHPAIQYLYRPGQALKRFRNRIHINQYGMRSDDLPEDVPEGHRRVLIFGDSVIFGGSQADQSMIPPAVLQQRLRKLGQPVDVGNVSADSWGPANWLGYGRTFGFFNATDVVMVISSEDAVDLPDFGPLDPITHPAENPPSALHELVQRYLKPKRLHARLSRWNPAADRGAVEPGPPAPEPEQLEQGLAYLDAFIEMAKASGARLSAVQFWERKEVESGVPRPEHAAVLALLQRHQVPTVQSGPMFRQCSSNPARELFIDHIHPFTPQGLLCMADVLQLALQKAGG